MFHEYAFHVSKNQFLRFHAFIYWILGVSGIDLLDVRFFSIQHDISGIGGFRIKYLRLMSQNSTFDVSDGLEFKFMLDKYPFVG